MNKDFEKAARKLLARHPRSVASVVAMVEDGKEHNHCSVVRASPLANGQTGHRYDSVVAGADPPSLFLGYHEVAVVVVGDQLKPS
jgi:hypothetical protein